jgi:hypothetical protein
MRIRSLLLPLLLTAPFAAAGNLKCDQLNEGVPAMYICWYYNGSLAQAYAAMRANRSEDDPLRLDHPHLPRTLPTRNFKHISYERTDYDGDGKDESYPIELSVRRLAPDIAIVEYYYSGPATVYSRETLFQRRGPHVEITIKRNAP